MRNLRRTRMGRVLRRHQRIPQRRLIAATTSVENIGTGTTRYWLEGNTGQPVHVTIGILQYGRETTTWGDDDDD